MGLLDFIFPKYCVSCKAFGSYICAFCFSKLSFSTQFLCLVCNRASFDGLTHPKCRSRYTIDGAFSSIDYRGLVKKLLYQFKYKPYLSDLTTVLGDLLYEGIIQHEALMKHIDLDSRLHGNDKQYVTAIPLHSSRFRQRGYNQSELLALSLSKKLNVDFIQLLKRVKDTKTQVGLDRKMRIENISGAFSIAHSILVSQYPSILLVDDILTTGSTLLEAAKVLKKAGVKKVFGLTLARD